MTVGKNHYEEIDGILNNKHGKISDDFKNKISLIEEVIGHSIYLNNKLNRIIKEENEAIQTEFDGPEALIKLLYERNIRYLIASYKLATLGLSNPSKATSRGVFEGITLIYLLYLTNREAELFYKQQTQTLTNAEENELINTYKYLAPRKVREILYEGAKKDKINNFYSSISDSTHPSIKGIIGDFKLIETDINDNLEGIMTLGLSNIIAMKESFSNKFDSITDGEFSDLMDRVAVELDGYMIDIIPNKSSLIGKLKFILSDQIHSIHK